MRNDLQYWRDAWFLWLLVSSAAVAIGVVMEGPEVWHDIVQVLRRRSSIFRKLLPLKEDSNHRGEAQDWIRLTAFIGLIFVIVGVIGEGVTESMVSDADGKLQSFDESVLTETKSETALAFARAAKTEKEAAQENALAAKAEKEAQEENAKAAKALESAETARKEAEGFQLQIAQANERAAQAEQRAAESTLEVARIKSSRTLTNTSKIIAALRLYKDTEYTFSGVCADDECDALLKQLDSILQSAGWKRGKSIGGFPSINVFGRDNPYSVPQSLLSGIRISVDSPEPIASLQSHQVSDLPPCIRAAIALDLNIFSNLVPGQPPTQEDGENKVNIENGTSTTVRISVGRKQI